jgi:hypothetical protein
MTVFMWPISPPSCLPKASIHGFWRRTMVIQQGVDTRAERGHDGVYVANPFPVMLAEGEHPRLCPPSPLWGGAGGGGRASLGGLRDPHPVGCAAVPPHQGAGE